MQIDHIELDQLRPYPNNARKHSRKQIGQIAKSIERFGFCNPVLVDNNNQIVAGHGRVQAAKMLGLDRVPVVRLSHLSEAEKRGYILADNKLAENAGWDRDLLEIELQGLIDLDFDIDLTGFETAEVDFILDDAGEANGTQVRREDHVAAYQMGAVVSRTHDLWALADHRLLCADPREQASYELLLDGQKAQFVFTDPLSTIGGNGGTVAGIHREFLAANGAMSEAVITELLQIIFARLAANTTDGSIHMICADWRHQAEMMAAGRAVYCELKDLCVWNKSNAENGSFYRSKHQLIYVWKSGQAREHVKLGQHGRRRSNVWNYPAIASQQAGQLNELTMHPTVKPVALVAEAIKDVSVPGDLVLDPFAGSGTVLIAAEQTGRKARTLEFDPAYVDVAVRRWQAYTGKVAVLIASGETFAQRVAQTTPELSPA